MAQITGHFLLLCISTLILKEAVAQTISQHDTTQILLNNSSRNCHSSGKVNNELLELYFSKFLQSTVLRFRVKNLEQLQQQLPEDCVLRGGSLNWHIHTSLTSNKNLFGVGPQRCNTVLTGGHYDPLLACGPSSGNIQCHLHYNHSTINALDKATAYSCSVDSYTNQDPLACELGDLSGKYGKLIIPAAGDIDIDLFISDPADIINPCDLINASIVIHCNASSKQALCLSLETSSSIDGFESIQREMGSEMIKDKNKSNQLIIIDNNTGKISYKPRISGLGYVNEIDHIEGRGGVYHIGNDVEDDDISDDGLFIDTSNDVVNEAANNTFNIGTDSLNNEEEELGKRRVDRSPTTNESVVMGDGDSVNSLGDGTGSKDVVDGVTGSSYGGNDNGESSIFDNNNNNNNNAEVDDVIELIGANNRNMIAVDEESTNGEVSSNSEDFDNIEDSLGEVDNHSVIKGDKDFVGSEDNLTTTTIATVLNNDDLADGADVETIINEHDYYQHGNDDRDNLNRAGHDDYFSRSSELTTVDHNESHQDVGESEADKARRDNDDDDDDSDSDSEYVDGMNGNQLNAPFDERVSRSSDGKDMYYEGYSDDNDMRSYSNEQLMTAGDGDNNVNSPLNHYNEGNVRTSRDVDNSEDSYKNNDDNIEEEGISNGMEEVGREEGSGGVELVAFNRPTHQTLLRV